MPARRTNHSRRAATATATIIETMALNRMLRPKAGTEPALRYPPKYRSRWTSPETTKATTPPSRRRRPRFMLAPLCPQIDAAGGTADERLRVRIVRAIGFSDRWRRRFASRRQARWAPNQSSIAWYACAAASAS